MPAFLGCDKSTVGLALIPVLLCTNPLIASATVSQASCIIRVTREALTSPPVGTPDTLRNRLDTAIGQLDWVQKGLPVENPVAQVPQVSDASVTSLADLNHLPFSERMAVIRRLSQPKALQFDPTKPWLRRDPKFPWVLDRKMPEVSVALDGFVNNKPYVKVDQVMVTGGENLRTQRVHFDRPLLAQVEGSPQHLGMNQNDMGRIKGQSILLIGEGHSPLLPHLMGQGHNVRAVDQWYHATNLPEQAMRMRDYNQRFGSHLIPGSAFDLPFEPNSIDQIWARRLINNLSPQKGLDALDEMWRALKPGGTIRVDALKVPKPAGARDLGNFGIVEESEKLAFLQSRYGKICRIETKRIKQNPGTRNEEVETVYIIRKARH